MPPPKREPAWVAPFLAALAACGNVTRAAALAGVDVTGPYNRRMRTPEFRAAWERVVAEREARASLDTLGMGGVLRDGPSTGSVSPQDERLAVSSTGVRLGRAAKSRWSRQAEERFLEELTASANVARAAAVAGFSAAAIYKRKLRDQHFASGWDAAIAVGRSRLEAHLIVAAERSFDPAGLPVAEGAPTVTVGEAISILKHKPAAAGAADWDEGGGLSEDEVKELREKIIDKLERTKAINDRERSEAGWKQDGEDWIPPGWVRA